MDSADVLRERAQEDDHESHRGRLILDKVTLNQGHSNWTRPLL